MGRNKKYIRKPRISNRIMSFNSQPRKYGTASIPIPHTDLMNTANIRARIIGLLWRVNFDMKELVFISKLYSVQLKCYSGCTIMALIGWLKRWYFMTARSEDTDKTNDDNKNNSEQNPIRLTLGHYYCAKCGQDGLSRNYNRCPKCDDLLRWDRVAIWGLRILDRSGNSLEHS